MAGSSSTKIFSNATLAILVSFARCHSELGTSFVSVVLWREYDNDVITLQWWAIPQTYVADHLTKQGRIHELFINSFVTHRQ